MISDCGFAFEPVKNTANLRSLSKIQQKFKALNLPNTVLNLTSTSAVQLSQPNPASTLTVHKALKVSAEDSNHISCANHEPATSSQTFQKQVPIESKTTQPIHTSISLHQNNSINIISSKTSVPENQFNNINALGTNDFKTNVPENQFNNINALNSNSSNPSVPENQFINDINVLDSDRFKKAQKALAQREFYVSNSNKPPELLTDNLSKIICKPNDKLSQKTDKKSLAAPRRRSTFGVRGKRASGIGNGFAASPHEAIETIFLYRHVSPETPEPLRLRQLLSWCVQRNNKPNIPLELEYNKNILSLAENALKEVIGELKAAIEGGVLTTSWYNRPKTDAETLLENQSPDDLNSYQNLKTKHPQNISNEKRKAELIEQIVTLQEENRKFNKIKDFSASITTNLNSMVKKDLKDSLTEYLSKNELNFTAKKNLPESDLVTLPALTIKTDSEIQDWYPDIIKYKSAYQHSLPEYYKTIYGHETNHELLESLSLKTQPFVDNLALDANDIQSHILSTSDLAEYSKSVVCKTFMSKNMDISSTFSDPRSLLLELSSSLQNTSI
ncbi:hypothetical protein BB561_003008 [Smittium simulii]|uniref:Kinetochore protein mis13 n=1 Tax=Smittium simulii TaxID=133385 RepID=A0A2T9YNA9_9FUNG|nr:hypothetical protein BB561_003008 [Smittium simulii]